MFEKILEKKTYSLFSEFFLRYMLTDLKTPFMFIYLDLTNLIHFLDIIYSFGDQGHLKMIR